MTDEQVIKHLANRLPDFRPIDPPKKLTGGLMNYVWRVKGENRSIIVKHAPPFAAAFPEIPLDQSRLIFEGHALSMFSNDGPLAFLASPTIRPPSLIDLDETAHILILEDLGTLPNLNEKPSEEAVRAVGTFIGHLHRATFENPKLTNSFNNRPVQETRFTVKYEVIGAICEAAGLEDATALGERASTLGKSLLEPGRCLIQGDLWPPSILIDQDYVRLIDWEFSHFGQPVQDLGHFAAHLWMRAHITETQDWVPALLDSYGASTHPELINESTRQAFGVHLGCEVLARSIGAFQTGYLYDGASQEQLDEAVQIAANAIRKGQF